MGLKKAAEHCGMTLGGVKALLFVTSRASERIHSCVGTVEEGVIRAQKWKKEMGKVASAPDYK